MNQPRRKAPARPCRGRCKRGERTPEEAGSGRGGSRLPPCGTCLACVRPVLVGNVRQGGTFRFIISGSPKLRIERVAPGARSRK